MLRSFFVDPSLQHYAATLLSFWKNKERFHFRMDTKTRLLPTVLQKQLRLTLYSKSEKSRPPLPPLNPPLKPGGAPRGGPKEPLLDGRPRPPRGPMKPRPRKPPLPRLCLRGRPNVSAFIRLSSAQVGLRSLRTHNYTHNYTHRNKQTKAGLGCWRAAEICFNNTDTTDYTEFGL